MAQKVTMSLRRFMDTTGQAVLKAYGTRHFAAAWREFQIGIAKYRKART